MTSFIQNLILGGTKNTIMIFFLSGAACYFADYKVLQTKSSYEREAKVSKFISLAFIIGSMFTFILLHILDWFL